MLKNDYCNFCGCVEVDERRARKMTAEAGEVLEEVMKDGGGSGGGGGGRRDGEERGGWWRW